MNGAAEDVSVEERSAAISMPDAARRTHDGAVDSPERAWLDLLIVLARRKGLILGCTVTMALLATVISLLLPARYTATTRILPPQQSPSLAATLIGQLAGLGPMATVTPKEQGLKNPNDVYIGMLRSRTVQDGLIRRFDLRRVYGKETLSEARRDLERASSIELSKEGLVSISVEDRERRRAADLANAYVEELRQLTQALAAREAGQRRAFYEQQTELAGKQLSQAEQSLKQTEQTTGLIQLDGQAKAIIEAAVKLRGAIAAKEVELQVMRLSATDRNPDVTRMEQELSGMRAELLRIEGRSSGRGQLQIPGGSVPEAGVEYVRRLRNVKYAETIWELLTKQSEAGRLDEAKNAAVIQVIDVAIEPEKKSAPHRSWIIAIAALFGLFASAAWAVLAEAFAGMRSCPATNVRFGELKAAVLGSWV
jgi:uncharacterized protein involved in exopolysaccharide biosynthesis